MSITSALITGGNRGIGLQFVKQFLALPSNPIVVATCRKPDDATELQNLKKSNQRLKIHKLELADFNSYKSFVEEVTEPLLMTGLNVLVNNAGIYENVDLKSGTPEQMLEHYKVNSIAPMMLIRYLLPLILSHEKININTGKRSSIVNISASLGCHSCQSPALGGQQYSYRMSKAALNMVTKQAASEPEFKKKRINVISIHPGWVSSDLGGPKAPMTPEQSVAHMMKIILANDPSTSGKMLNYDGKIMPW